MKKFKKVCSWITGACLILGIALVAGGVGAKIGVALEGAASPWTALAVAVFASFLVAFAAMFGLDTLVKYHEAEVIEARRKGYELGHCHGQADARLDIAIERIRRSAK